MILIKRIYDKPDEKDGYRILVDRLWPRGIKKEDAHVDVWLKQISPTTDLRKWFDHRRERWEEFQSKYIEELKQNEAVKELDSLIKNHDTVSLLYAAKDKDLNHALVLRNFLEKNRLK